MGKLPVFPDLHGFSDSTVTCPFPKSNIIFILAQNDSHENNVVSLLIFVDLYIRYNSIGLYFYNNESFCRKLRFREFFIGKF